MKYRVFFFFWLHPPSERGIRILRVVHTVVGRPEEGADAIGTAWVRAESSIAIGIVLAGAQLKWCEVQGVCTGWCTVRQIGVLVHIVGHRSRHQLRRCVQERTTEADAALVASKFGTTILEPDLRWIGAYKGFIWLAKFTRGLPALVPRSDAPWWPVPRVQMHPDNGYARRPSPGLWAELSWRWCDCDAASWNAPSWDCWGNLRHRRRLQRERKTIIEQLIRKSLAFIEILGSPINNRLEPGHILLICQPKNFRAHFYVSQHIKFCIPVDPFAGAVPNGRVINIWHGS